MHSTAHGQCKKLKQSSLDKSIETTWDKNWALSSNLKKKIKIIFLNLPMVLFQIHTLQVDMNVLHIKTIKNNKISIIRIEFSTQYYVVWENEMSKCFLNCKNKKNFFWPSFSEWHKCGVFTFLQLKNLLRSFKDLFLTSGHNMNGIETAQLLFWEKLSRLESVMLNYFL